MIVRHSSCRQDDLKLEKELEEKEWPFRVNSSILAILIVDAWNLYKSSNVIRQSKSQHKFCCKLADELMHNTWDRIKFMASYAEQLQETEDQPQTAGTGVHLMQKNRKQKRLKGSTTKALH